MITEDNLSKLYEDVLIGNELTTKELNSFKFNSKDLNDLIDQGIIVRVKRGLYSLKSVEKLFYYGKKLIAQKEYDKATLCFEKCFEMDPTHTGVSFQLFLRCIQSKNYEKAFEYFDIFYNSEKEFYNTDNKFYLYLLSMITTLPENYRERAKHLSLNDIRVDFWDKRYDSVSSQNRIRLFAFNQKFILAIKELNKSIEEKGSLSVQDITIKTLLNQAVEEQLKNKEMVIDLIKQKKYDKIIDFYNKKMNSHYLNDSDKFTFILTKKLLDIINSKSIPRIQIYNTNNIFTAINGNNFELALKLVDIRNQEKKYKKDINIIYLLLNEIVSMCKTLKENSSKSQEQEIIESKQIQSQPIVKTSDAPVSSSSTFADIFRFLMNNDLDNTFKTLKNYLASTNKLDYEFLIIDLIKVSILENDKAFTKPMTNLALISRKNYSFDISSYIQEFYINLSNNNFEIARIYLDIISKGNELSSERIVTDGLYQILESSQKMLDSEKNSKNLDSVNVEIEERKDYKPTNVTNKSNYDDSKVEQKTDVDKKDKMIKEQIKAEKDFIDSKYEELLNNKGVILLKPMDNDRISRIIEMVKDYEDVVAFVIDDDNKKRIVLRYKPKSEYVDVSNILHTANKAYKDGDYDECIESSLQLLQIFAKPRSIIYFQLGISYLRKSQKTLAIDYLIIANALTKKENLNFDFSDMIDRLKGNISSEEEKPQFKMTIKDFDYSDVSDCYGIDNFTEINSYIIESGLDVESACKQLGLVPEKIDIVNLIYAKCFYTQGNYHKGDLFLKSVETSQNKTKETKRIFEEIRKNKKFYQNRQEKTPINPVLTLRPRTTKPNKN